VHLVSSDESVIGAIAAGSDPDDLLTTYPRAKRADHTGVAGATHALLDLGVIDGHGIGSHTLRGWLVRCPPRLRVSVRSNAAIPAILPTDLRGSRVRLLTKRVGSARLARLWGDALRAEVPASRDLVRAFGTSMPYDRGRRRSSVRGAPKRRPRAVSGDRGAIAPRRIGWRRSA